MPDVQPAGCVKALEALYYFLLLVIIMTHIFSIVHFQPLHLAAFIHSSLVYNLICNLFVISPFQSSGPPFQSRHGSLSFFVINILLWSATSVGACCIVTTKSWHSRMCSSKTLAVDWRPTCHCLAPPQHHVPHDRKVAPGNL